MKTLYVIYCCYPIFRKLWIWSSLYSYIHLQKCICIFDIKIPSQYGSVPSWHDLCQFLCPGSRNPVFCPVVQFFKKYIFGIYMLWGVSGCKKFPGQILSGIRFLPKSIIFRHFSQFVTYVHPK